jgi:hypothetical protein
MSTVSKEIADRITAGEFASDNPRLIIEYDNNWGGKGYGVIFAGQSLGLYEASDFVHNPKVYWRAAE